MAHVVDLVSKMYHLIDKYGDPRVQHWPMISHPMYATTIVLAYIYIVKFLGPRIMQNRPPVRLKKTILVYNLLQILFSAYVFYEIGMSGWFTRCQPVDYSNRPSALRMLHAWKWFHIAKFTELFDTIFLVLNKKYSHVSALHVIHHSIMPVSTWIGMRFFPGGHASFCALLNSFVHVVMYSYYFLSALGPHMQKYLWWKKYLTRLQILQFFSVTVHSLLPVLIDCRIPPFQLWFILSHAVLFLCLFSIFYNKTYKKKQLAAKKE